MRNHRLSICTKGGYMGYTVAEKLIASHLVSGDISKKGSEIGLRIDQTLTQDATGTMAYLQLEAMEIDRVKTELSVAYIDHNTLQNGFENADDHKFIQTVAKKRGLKFSRPGNGICHQVHLERFGKPGKSLLGSDSHTPTGGGIGMLAMGAGGLDVAVAMGGGTYYINMPEIIGVNLCGKLCSWVSAKDVILKVLEILSVKGGVGKIIEYTGDGVKTLTAPERATITNMGAELGATTSVFPSDEITKEFLAAQGREADWTELKADNDAVYDRVIDIDLSALKPLAAMPHMPDKVKSVKEIGEIAVDQVCIGSCTNSSFIDMMKVAHILKGRRISPNVSLAIAPGSKQVLTMLAQNGALADMIDAGARILESACGPCIGMGQSPKSGGVSLRTFNRNFEGRSGTADAQIFLVSPETAAVSAITGVLTDPSVALGEMPHFKIPDRFIINDNMIEEPAAPEEAGEITVYYGPNIKSVPLGHELEDTINSKVMLKVGDNITTDHIAPAGAKVLPYRSNVPYLATFCFKGVDPDFASDCLEQGGGIIIGGHNYGQGSSREHAALAPLHLGIRAVVAKSFARMHKANLINSGIMPLTFANESDYDRIDKYDEIELYDIKSAVENGSEIKLINKTKGEEYTLIGGYTGREKSMILCGGRLNALKAGRL